MTSAQQAILEFEVRWRHGFGDKDVAIRRELGLDPDRYYRMLVDLVDDPQAQVHAPATLARYRRLRAAQRIHRARARRHR